MKNFKPQTLRLKIYKVFSIFVMSATIFNMSSLGVLFPALEAGAATTTIFSDGFEANPIFTNWTSVDHPKWDVNSSDDHSGNRSARIEDSTGAHDDILRKNVSTVGKQIITLSYWYKISEKLENDDHIYVEWSDNGSNWNQAAHYSNISAGNWTSASITLLGGADNKANFSFRFRANLDSSHDEFRLDDVVVTGDDIQVCGNNIKEGTEVCDGQDGTFGDHQSCNASCQIQNLTYCGDGQLQTLNGEAVAEECDGDAGVGEHQSCSQECLLENLTYCGDGKIQTPNDEQVSEACDGEDGTFSEHQSCNASCQIQDLTYCGDGELQIPNDEEVAEECDGDDGIGEHQNCSQECLLENLTYCGDGKIQTPNDEEVSEECDDGPNGSSACTFDCQEITTPAINYCGDGKVNQAWEQCDGTTGCTDKCLSEQQAGCSDLVLARVKVNNFSNVGAGSVTSDIYLGSATNILPNNTWFALYYNGAYINDADVATNPQYEDVPGLAVQRLDGKVRTILHGSLEQEDREHVDGTIEFYNATATGYSSDNSNDYPKNNKLEDNDSVSVSGNSANFDLTINTADDGFYTDWSIVNDCQVEIRAHKIVCDNENLLPNWGDGSIEGGMITAETASNFVESVPGCHWAEEPWTFQWGVNQSHFNGDVIGDQFQDGTWKNFETQSNGSAPAVAYVNLAEMPDRVWARESLKNGYIPFSAPENSDNSDTVFSAEFYCHDDVLNYDNSDFINLNNSSNDNVYYCIAFNVPTPAPQLQVCKYDEKQNPLGGWEMNIRNSQNLVSNGGFETPAVNANDWALFENGATGLEWTIEPADGEGSPVLEIQDHAALYNPAEGDQHAELDANEPMTISQNINTIAGKKYQLNFSFSARPERNGDDNKLRVQFGNVDEQITLDGTSNQNTDWHNYNYVITASDDTLELKFTDMGTPNSYGTFLDNVSVYEVISDTTKSSDGCVIFDSLDFGNYQVTETMQKGWTRISPTSGVHDVVLSESHPSVTVSFVNQQDDNGGGDEETYSIHGIKWNDVNGNGENDCQYVAALASFVTGSINPCEAYLSGWEIYVEKKNGDFIASTTTSSDIEHFGWYWFEGLPAGEYRICETGQNGWKQTYPSDPNCYEIVLPADALKTLNAVDAPQYDFGNQYIGEEESVCGDKVCNKGETCSSCPGDCGSCGGSETSCGDQSCNGQETCSSCPSDCGSCGSSGVTSVGGGTPYISSTLDITNPQVTMKCAGDSISLVMTWLTNKPGTSRVVYDTVAHPDANTIGEPNYGYAYSTIQDSNKVTGHSVEITGLKDQTVYYFRPISSASPEVLGEEKILTQTLTCGVNGSNEVIVLGEEGSPLLKITKTASTKFANAGDKNIEYTVTVANEGKLTSFATVLVDQLPEGLKYQDHDSNTRIWNLGDIKPGENKVITYKADVNQSAPDNVYINTATVHSDNHDFVSATAELTVGKVKVLAATGFNVNELILLSSILVGLIGASRLLRKKNSLSA